MKKMIKQTAAVLLSVMCLSLAGCGQTANSGKDWTKGEMEINGGAVTIGKSTIDEFKEATGFTEEVKVFESSQYTNYFLSDGYSIIEIRTSPEGICNHFHAVPAGVEEYGDAGIDVEHTTVIGPGGIQIGKSTVEEMVEYDQNTPNRYESSVHDEPDYGYCTYIAGLQGDGSYAMKNGYLYSVVGDLETRVIYDIGLDIGSSF